MKAILQFFSRFSKWIPGFIKKTPQDAASFAIGMATSELITPFIKPTAYAANRARPVMKAGVADYIDGVIRGSLDINKAREEIKGLGFDNTVFELMLKGREQFLDVGSIQALYNRGEITEEVMHEKFAAMGFSPESQQQLTSLAGYIPTVPDFIRMAVREVFTPNTRSQYGLDEDYPQQLSGLAQKAGLNPEYAMDYWAAHWELPSISQGFDMYHRGIISKEALVNLLRSLDVMPFWRDKIIELSETPFTRVDVRRMYSLGVLTFDEVVKAYKDVGYSEEKANKLAEFVKADLMEGERELTKGEVTALYREGVLPIEDARGMLADLGYQEENVASILALEDLKAAGERFRSIKNAVKKRYVRGMIDRNDVVVLLAKTGITNREITTAVETWDLEIEEISAMPTRAEVFRFYKKGIVNEDTVRDMLQKMGYETTFVEWYMADLKGGK